MGPNVRGASSIEPYLGKPTSPLAKRVPYQARELLIGSKVGDRTGKVIKR